MVQKMSLTIFPPILDNRTLPSPTSTAFLLCVSLIRIRPSDPVEVLYEPMPHHPIELSHVFDSCRATPGRPAGG